MTAREHSLVSVITCVYNAGAYLRPAVQSVLAQSHRHLELLIIDDGSTDGCVESISDLKDDRMRIVRQENRGKPAAMNVALDLLRGEFYAVHDADDISHPERVERQLRCLMENPDVAAVFCGNDLIINDQRVAPRFSAKDRRQCAADIAGFRMPAHDPTVMYRVEAVRGIRYSEDLFVGEGLDYILRVGEKHPMVVLGECLYSYRQILTSITKGDPLRRASAVQEVQRRACVRRGLKFEDTPHLANPSQSGHLFRQDNNLPAHFIESAVDQAVIGKRWNALQTAIQCVRIAPSDIHYYKALVLALLPLRLHPVLRGRSKRSQSNSYPQTS